MHIFWIYLDLGAIVKGLSRVWTMEKRLKTAFRKKKNAERLDGSASQAYPALSLVRD